ncbi:DUF3078 domain-containing protein [soil metagenome]
MKKIILALLCLIFINTTAKSQAPAGTDTLWRKGSIFAFNFNQVNFSNWAGGGENSISLSALGSMYANYKSGRIAWDNNLELGYGFLKQGDLQLRKNEDKINLTTKIGYDATNKAKWYYTAQFDFKSQFTPGYTYIDSNDTKVEISKFAAPAYMLFSLGMDYKPNDNFSVFLSPLTLKLTIVNEKKYTEFAPAYGVEQGKTSRTELGSYLNVKFQKEILTNVKLITKVDLFSNYKDNPDHIDVNWDLLLAMKVNKAITVSFFTQVIYDHDIEIPLYEGSGRDKVQVGVGPRTQFKQSFGIGLTYKLEGYSVR